MLPLPNDYLFDFIIQISILVFHFVKHYHIQTHPTKNPTLLLYSNHRSRIQRYHNVILFYTLTVYIENYQIGAGKTVISLQFRISGRRQFTQLKYFRSSENGSSDDKYRHNYYCLVLQCYKIKMYGRYTLLCY